MPAPNEQRHLGLSRLGSMFNVIVLTANIFELGFSLRSRPDLRIARLYSGGSVALGA
jgi:hypothetical protein